MPPVQKPFRGKPPNHVPAARLPAACGLTTFHLQYCNFQVPGKQPFYEGGGGCISVMARSRFGACVNIICSRDSIQSLAVFGFYFFRLCRFFNTPAPRPAKCVFESMQSAPRVMHPMHTSTTLFQLFDDDYFLVTTWETKHQCLKVSTGGVGTARHPVGDATGVRNDLEHLQ